MDGGKSRYEKENLGYSFAIRIRGWWFFGGKEGLKESTGLLFFLLPWTRTDCPGKRWEKEKQQCPKARISFYRLDVHNTGNESQHNNYIIFRTSFLSLYENMTTVRRVQVQWSPHHETILASSGSDRRLHVWDLGWGASGKYRICSYTNIYILCLRKYTFCPFFLLESKREAG